MTMHYRPLQLSVLFVVALLVAVTVESFSSHLASTTTTRRQHLQQQEQRPSLAFVASSSSPALTTRLFAEGEATAEEETATTEEEEEPETTEAKGEEEEDAKEEEEEEAVDDEVTALKEEIAGFEKELQNKRASLQSLQDSLDLYSKAGYIRRIAQIENLKRSQQSRAASSKDAAVGSVVAEFLPVLERLQEQKDQYAESQFGTNYAGLTGALKSSLTSLGLQEYTVAPGEPVDVLRIKVVDSQHSDQYAVDTVVECQSAGFEMGGTVLRPADCVVSLGSESANAEEEEEAEEESAEEEAASEDE